MTANPVIHGQGDTHVHVAFLTDQKYTNLTAVAISSLVKAFARDDSLSASPQSGIPSRHLSIHIVCIDVNAAGKQEMASAAVSAGVSIRFVDHCLEGNPQGKLRWVRLVSLKMHLPAILADVPRVIFLDSDIVVVGDLTPLWQTDLEGCWLGVVPCLLDDPGNLRNYNIFRIRFNHVAEPINAGVLLLDLAKMRDLDVSARLSAWQEDHLKRLKLPEQEAISANYPRQWKVLSHAWNFRPYGEPYWTGASWQEFRRYLGIKPAIVHFQGNVRPWDLRIDLPYYTQWLESQRRVNGDAPLRRKKLGYFQFVFFEYPDIMFRVGNLLPGGLVRFGLMISLLGMCAMPVAAFAYLRYLRNPDGYRLRIRRWMQPGS